MIDGNVIKFGYGDIAVGNNNLESSIMILHINQVAEIGESLLGREFTTINKKTLHFDLLKEMYDFKSKLLSIDENNTKMYWHDVILDFSNFNNHSIESLLSAIERLIANHIFLSAC